jgi:hypothetical protein
MPVYKGTLLFSYQGLPPVGFSESIMFNAASDAAAKTSIAAWPAQRRKWLASQWQIVGFRLATVTLSGSGGTCKASFKPVQIGACVGTPGGLLGDADTPFTGVLFRVTFNSPTKRARNYIGRGIPDSWWTAGALSIPAGDGNKFLAWFNYMVSQGAGAYGYAAKKALPCPEDLALWKSYCTQRIASRRIGRPFGLIRGRKSKKKAPPP